MTGASSVFDILPAPEPLAGGWRESARRLVDDPLQAMNALRELGDVVALARGGNGPLMFPGSDCPGTVFFFGPELNRLVLTRTDVFHSGPIIGPIYGAAEDDPRFAVLKRVGTGLFSLNGEAHQRQRRLIQPAFHKKQIDVYARAMQATTERAIQAWSDGQQLDFQREMFRHTLTVAGLALFGLDFSSDVDHLGAAIQEWLELIPVVSLDADVIDREPVQRFLALSERIDAEVRALIAWKRSRSDSGDVLAELVHVRDEHGDALSEDELIGHINILLTAGHETTANALSWTAFLLALHPEVMAALQDEIHQAAHPFTLDSVAGLLLLDRVIKESMRVLPPVTIGSRVLVEPLNVKGYDLPADTEIVFSHYHTHHDPVIYPEPGRFQPDRWRTVSPSPYEYLPFSTGTKMCIGAPFALAEIKLTLALMLDRFGFELAQDAEVNRVVWVPLRPDHMPLVIREGSSSVGGFSLMGSVLEMLTV